MAVITYLFLVSTFSAAVLFLRVSFFCLSFESYRLMCVEGFGAIVGVVGKLVLLESSSRRDGMKSWDVGVGQVLFRDFFGLGNILFVLPEKPNVGRVSILYS